LGSPCPESHVAKDRSVEAKFVHKRESHYQTELHLTVARLSRIHLIPGHLRTYTLPMVGHHEF
jgi:hypothetical protein